MGLPRQARPENENSMLAVIRFVTVHFVLYEVSRLGKKHVKKLQSTDYRSIVNPNSANQEPVRRRCYLL